MKKDWCSKTRGNITKAAFSKWVPEIDALAPPGYWLEMLILGPSISGLLNQKLWGWDPGIWILTSPPNNSDALPSLKTTRPEVQG